MPAADIDKYVNSLDEVSASADKASASIDEVGKSSEDTAKKTKKSTDAATAATKQYDRLITINNKLADAIEKHETALEEYRKGTLKNKDVLIKYAKGVKDAQKELVAYKKMMERIDAASKGQGRTTYALSKSYGAFTDSMSKAHGGMGKMLALFGAGAFSFKGIYDAALEYNEALVTLSMTQGSARGEIINLEDSLGDLTEATSMSKTEFLGLAKSISEAFIGVPPATSNISALVKAIRSQNMSLKETQQNTQLLMQVQAKSNDMYEIQKQSLDILYRARQKGKGLSESERTIIRQNNDTMRQYGTALGFTSEQLSKLQAQTQEMTKEQKDQWQSTMDAEKAQAEFKNAAMELGRVALPMFTKLAKAATSFLKLIQKFKGPVMALASTLAILNASISFYKWAKDLKKVYTALKGISIFQGMFGTMAVGTSKLGVALVGVKASFAAIIASLGGGIAGFAAMSGIIGATAVAMYGFAKAADWLIGKAFGTKLSEAIGIGAANFTEGRDRKKFLKENNKFLDDLKGQYEDADMKKLIQDRLSGVDLGDAVGGQILYQLKMELDSGSRNQMSKDMKKLQDQALKMQNEVSKKMAEGDKEGAKVKIKALEKVRQQIKDLASEEETGNLRQIEQAKAVAEARIAVLSKITKVYQTQAKLAEQVGMVEMESLKRNVDLLKQEESELENVLNTVLDLAEKKRGLELEGDNGYDKANSALQQMQLEYQELIKLKKEYEKQAEDTKSDEKRLDLQKKIQDVESKIMSNKAFTKDLSEAQTNAEEKRQNVIMATRDVATAEVKQMEKMTTKAEARLSAERKLMESAQFGLGASVEMMQKQVDLASRMKDTYAAGREEIIKSAASIENVNEAQARGLQDIDTAADAQKYIENTLGKSGDEARLLMAYWGDLQDFKTKELQQQQKIYDLTKDVREGYLDAIREMAVGAGEFTKIIGTQDKGVTQLMRKVKDVTGQDRLNTMALGGVTARGAESGRTTAAGRFTTGGLEFIGGKQQEMQNVDIFRYEKKLGEGTTVGDVAAATPEVMAAKRAGDEGAERKREYGDAVRKGVKERKFKQDSNKIDPRTSIRLGKREAAKAKPSAPAEGVMPIDPGKPYTSGKTAMKIEVSIVPTGELSKFIERTDEVVTALA